MHKHERVAGRTYGEERLRVAVPRVEAPCMHLRTCVTSRPVGGPRVRVFCASFRSRRSPAAGVRAAARRAGTGATHSAPGRKHRPSR